LRGLKALVAGLGVLIVVGTAVVIGVIIKRIYASPAPASNFSAAPVPGYGLPADSLASLPAGSHIAGLAGSGGVFAVWVTGPKGGQLYLLNPQTGALHLAVQAPP